MRFKVAAGEVERAGSRPCLAADRTIPAADRIRSALKPAHSDVLLYRLNCTVCGDGFELEAIPVKAVGDGDATRSKTPGAPAEAIRSKIFKRKALRLESQVKRLAGEVSNPIL